jgi:hypothetical protein
LYLRSILYHSAIGQLIAKYQLPNGGPIILVQAENEYTSFASGHSEDYTYENELKSALRAAGITVPLTFNDAYPGGHFTSVDIWGYVNARLIDDLYNQLIPCR